MGSTYVSLRYHLVFSTKNRRPFIAHPWRGHLHEYLGGWQDGYAAFTVSASLQEKVRRYIERQPEHHRKVAFIDELRSLLEKHGVAYNPKYLE
jgi:REP element-mobilizing transposase RayT